MKSVQAEVGKRLTLITNCGFRGYLFLKKTRPCNCHEKALYFHEEKLFNEEIQDGQFTDQRH